MKKGPPDRAVTIPTGKSIGARTILLSVSHNMMNIAPTSIDEGIKIL